MSTVLNHVPVNTNRIAEIELEPSRISSSPRKSSGNAAAPAAAKSTSKVLHLGFDWGTNKSCLKASFAGSQDLLLEEIIPTLVGYAKEGIIAALLPDNATVLFGNEAIRHRLHLKLVRPISDGVVEDLAAARDFAQHLRSRINVPAGTEVRAVIGVPANADATAREN